MVVHERSYRGIHPFSFFHRLRLRRIVKATRSLSLPPDSAIADFGCSNGFFFAELLQAMPEAGSFNLFGFDHSAELLAAARSRNIDNAVFDYVDLNEPPGDRRSERQFDLVACFETLEHVGNVANAIESLLAACKPGGALLISAPNEVGLPGLLKYAARKVVRRRPYEGFFRGQQSEAWYVWALLTGRSITAFRDPAADGYGPHLGFDWRVVLDHLHRSQSCRVTRVDSLIFGYVIVARKA